MQNPVYVTKIAERVPQFRGGIEMRPYSLEDYEWWSKNYGDKSFTFSKLNSSTSNLFNKLSRAVKDRNRLEVDKLIPQVEKLCIKSYEEKTEAEKWGDMAVQLPGDWGPIGENKKKLKEMITERSFGRVLEAMCGFRSYFDNSSKITEVVALDFCEEALERHDYPERKRILYDLERVVKGEKIGFFEDKSFQTIGVFFAIDYLTDTIPVYKEFHRILSDDSQLLIVGGTTQGYPDLLKRQFIPADCSSAMRAVGFSPKIKHLPLKAEHESGEYYLVEGEK